MIKICQVVSDTNIGGAGRYLLNYLKYYDRENYEVSVILPEKSSLLEFVKAYPEVKIYEMPYMADSSFDKRAVGEMQKLFKREKFDILHTHASLSARIAGRKARIKTIISTRHCIEAARGGLVAKVKGFLNNKLCDYYIAVSDAVADNLLACGIRKEKIKVVYNGVEPLKKYDDKKRQEVKSKYKINDGKVFGIFARLEEVKGHRYFIESAKEYLSKGNKATFLIVGDGTLKNELQKMADGVPQIIFTGYVKNTEELLNITDVNVIASQSEAMSLAILEAMSLGIPTIATNVGGNPQIVLPDKNGILTEYGDVSAMALAFEHLSSDDELYKKLSLNSIKMFNQSFTAEIMIKNLQQLYQEVSNGKE